MKQSTRSLLYEAMRLMNEARSTIQEALNDDKELEDKFGYDMQITMQELDKFGENRACYQSGNTSLFEILEEQPEEEWEED